MSSTYSIEIDCPPFTPRPDTHFSNLCKECSIDAVWFNNPTKSFGNWEWTVKQEYEKNYQEKQSAVKNYLTSLYRSGSIRYASW